MGYSYGNMGGGTRKLYTHSNVWFYPRIRVVPQSEYSYWGITDTDCLVFDTYFFSNSKFTNTGATDDQIVTSATIAQLPKRIFYKDETDGTTKEAQAVGYDNDYELEASQRGIYQAVWIRPQVVKCTTSKGYVVAINCSVNRWNRTQYYMGKAPVKPADFEDSFEEDEETSETLKWKQISSNDEASGSTGDEYWYFKDFDSTSSPKDITYYLFRSVDKIYKYRTFYFIVPTGCQICFAVQGLDFFAYNGVEYNSSYGAVFTQLKTYKSLVDCPDDDRSYMCAYFNGWLNTTGRSSASVSEGILIDNKQAWIGGFTDIYSTPYKGPTKLYDSSQSSNTAKWQAALSNQMIFYNFNSSTGTFDYWKSAYGNIEIDEDNKLVCRNSSNNGLSISGMTINFGEPHCQYMYSPYDLNHSDYYGYLNTACQSLYGCTPVYLSESRGMGMKNTTITESTSFSSSGYYSGTTTVQNDHDSNAYYRVIVRCYNFDGGWTWVANPSESWIDDMSSKTYSYSGSSSKSPYYIVQVACTNISETEFGEIIIYQHQYTNSNKLIGVDTSMNTNYYANVTLYYNSGSYSARISNSSSLRPTTYISPVWYEGSITKIVSNTKSWSHSCRQYSRCLCYHRTYDNNSWSSLTGSWKYNATFSSSSSIVDWYDTDITLTCNWSSNSLRKQVYFTMEYGWISSPTISSCTDGGDWKRTIVVKNNNPIELTLGYSSNKTSNKTSANSGWSTVTIAASSSTTLTIQDQGGFSDEWILCGFKVGSSLFYCVTIDEDPGSVNYVQTNFYYSR